MKPVGFIGTGVLLLLLGAVAPTYAQQDQHQQDSTAPKQEQQAKPNKQQQQRAQQQNQNKQQQQRAQQQNRNRQQAYRPSQQGKRVQQAQERGVWQQRRAHNWQSDHRDWQQRGGYNGYRIPDARYRSHFGRDHRFRLYRYPMFVVDGYPSFQYGGFWFTVLDPWPEYWSDNWYENDDVYVDYSNGGYYLYDQRYPGVGIAVSISLN
ncbi:MAG TPA: hypothetical protein VNK23_02555 [Candidatus Dormibacteraeota bacterium]|nr:hypothetical protein [Candidatus Dormibacteraeota bacterium]